MPIEINSRLSNFVLKATNEDLDRILQNVNNASLISFAGGLPDPSIFPSIEIGYIAYEAIQKNPISALQYGSTYGVPDLIEEIKKFMKDKLKIKINDDEKVLVTNGSQEALFSITSTFINPGDYVITENPTYFVATSVFKAFNSKIVGVNVNSNGIDVYKLEEKIKKLNTKPKFLYVMPNCHNPMGVMMDEESKKHLIEIANKYDLLVIEDDPYSLINYEGKTPIPLKAYDSEERVIYMSTFSKILSPGLRLGWIYGNKKVVDKIAISKQIISLNTSTLVQHIAAEALRRGIVEKTIEKVIEVYKHKRDIMISAFEQYIGNIIEYEKPQSGMFFFVKFNNINTRDLLSYAIKSGVMYLPGDITFVEDTDFTTARLNFTYPSESMIIEGMRRLSNAIKEYKS